MVSEEQKAYWRQLSDEVARHMVEWRREHPKATFRQIETALDERLAKLRTQMLQDTAQASAAATAEGEDRPLCPDCGQPMEGRG